MIETLTIVIIIGILSAIAAPSFLGMLNRNKVNDALAQAKGALEEAQREAIRRSKRCPVNIFKITKQMTGSCLVTGNRIFDSSIGIETNQTSIEFSYRGTINLADDATVVLYNPEDASNKKCIVVSTPLGIVRVGNYTGSITGGGTVSSNNCKKQ